MFVRVIFKRLSVEKSKTKTVWKLLFCSLDKHIFYIGASLFSLLLSCLGFCLLNSQLQTARNARSRLGSLQRLIELHPNVSSLQQLAPLRLSLFACSRKETANELAIVCRACQQTWLALARRKCKATVKAHAERRSLGALSTSRRYLACRALHGVGWWTNSRPTPYILRRVQFGPQTQLQKMQSCQQTQRPEIYARDYNSYQDALLRNTNILCSDWTELDLIPFFSVLPCVLVSQTRLCLALDCSMQPRPELRNTMQAVLVWHARETLISGSLCQFSARFKIWAAILSSNETRRRLLDS